MSKVSIEGNASGTGTLTIAAPNTNTNYTLTLPTNTGTIITQNSTPAFASTIGVGGATAAASGAGVTFPATASASSDANTLDDYEEGTWTPAYAPETNSFTSITYFGSTSGRYTRVGDLCFINGQILTTALTIGSASGSLRITGLPFNAQSGTGSANIIPIMQTEAWNTQNPNAGAINGNSTTMVLRKRTAADGASTALDVNQMGTGTSNYAFFAGVYKIA